MKGKYWAVAACSILTVALWSTVSWSGPESDPLKPRVPDAERGEARKMKSPLTVTPAVIAKGQELYEGKGTCANCHGERGVPMGSVLDYEGMPVMVFDRAYLSRTDPDVLRTRVWHMLERQAPMMPHYREALDAGQARAIIEFLRQAPPPAAVPPG